MSLDDLNREQKRSLKRMGAISETGAPTRTAPVARRAPTEQRTTPATYIREVRDEMRKVAWPHWPEVRKYAIIVLVAVVIYTGYVFGLDSLFGQLSSWLYD
jgi:preprotein translocase subunit SecE